MALPTRRTKQDGAGTATAMPFLNIAFVLLVLFILFDNSPPDGGADISNNKNGTTLKISNNETRSTFQHLRKREVVRESEKDKTPDSLNTTATIIDDTKPRRKRIYDCLYDIDIHTVFKLENIKIPLGKKGFSMNIIRTSAAPSNEENKETTSLFQTNFRFPIGIGGSEFYSQKEVMTVKDLEDKILNYAFKELEDEGEHHYPLVAIIEEYVEDNNQNEKEEPMVYDMTVCHSMEEKNEEKRSNEAKQLIQV